MTKNNHSYDSPWKEILDAFFPQFMDFFIPQSSEDIDWNKEIKFLDTEFQKITKDSVPGRRYADKLVEVTFKDNSIKWILIHVEVQAQKEADFSKRMFRYNYRIFDRYNIPVTSIAVLADGSASWDPGPYKKGSFKSF